MSLSNIPDFVLIERGNMCEAGVKVIENDSQKTQLLLNILDGYKEEITLIDSELDHRYLDYLALTQEVCPEPDCSLTFEELSTKRPV